MEKNGTEVQMEGLFLNPAVAVREPVAMIEQKQVLLNKLSLTA